MAESFGQVTKVKSGVDGIQLIFFFFWLYVFLFRVCALSHSSLFPKFCVLSNDVMVLHRLSF